MSLLQNWRDIAYNQEADKKQLQQFWTNYFLIEKNIYEQLLSNPDEVVKGTVKELAEKYKVDVMTMVGFLDGINDSLVIPNPIEEMEEDTVVTLAYDKELLYKNMVDAKADWLYNLPMWDEIFTEEQKKTLYMEQKKSGTVIKGKKIGRNDPCPCGSGKKYKKCCGKNASNTTAVRQRETNCFGQGIPSGFTSPRKRCSPLWRKKRCLRQKGISALYMRMTRFWWFPSRQDCSHILKKAVIPIR